MDVIYIGSRKKTRYPEWIGSMGIMGEGWKGGESKEGDQRKMYSSIKSIKKKSLLAKLYCCLSSERRKCYKTLETFSFLVLYLIALIDV